MADIMKNEIVSYANLKKYILQKIKESCCNIDRVPCLPDDLIPGKTLQVNSDNGQFSQNLCFTITDYEHIIVDSNNNVKQVSSNTVERQFNEFLASRGLVNKPNIPISSKAMLNLFNNIAIFISSRTRIYKSNNNEKSMFVFYNENEMSYSDYDQSSPFVFETDKLKNTDSAGQVSNEDARNSVKSLIQQINKTSKITAAAMTIRCVCSSSSSCSSSSCSSSCCSSSSSSFIVYMLI